MEAKYIRTIITVREIYRLANSKKKGLFELKQILVFKFVWHPKADTNTM